MPNHSVPAIFGKRRFLISMVPALSLAFCLSSVPGCGSKPPPQPKVAAHLQTLAVLYGSYRGGKGQSPPDLAAFKKYIESLPTDRLMGNTAEELFISPRDKQPYVVIYNVKPTGMPGGTDPVPLVAYEQTGVDGKRYIADVMVGVKEVDESPFQTLLPKK